MEFDKCRDLFTTLRCRLSACEPDKCSHWLLLTFIAWHCLDALPIHTTRSPSFFLLVACCVHFGCPETRLHTSITYQYSVPIVSAHCLVFFCLSPPDELLEQCQLLKQLYWLWNSLLLGSQIAMWIAMQISRRCHFYACCKYNLHNVTCNHFAVRCLKTRQQRNGNEMYQSWLTWKLKEIILLRCTLGKSRGSKTSPGQTFDFAFLPSRCRLSWGLRPIMRAFVWEGEQWYTTREFLASTAAVARQAVNMSSKVFEKPMQCVKRPGRQRLENMTPKLELQLHGLKGDCIMLWQS